MNYLDRWNRIRLGKGIPSLFFLYSFSWFAQCMKKHIKRKRKDYPLTELELYTWLTDYYSNVNDVQGVKRYIEALFQEKEHQEITDEELYLKYTDILKECCKLAANKQNSVTEIEKVINKYI